MRPLRIRPVLDSTIIAATAGPALVLSIWVIPQLPDAAQGSTDSSRIGKADRVALGRYSEAPALGSDVLLGVSLLAPLTYHFIEAATYRRGFSRVRGRGFGARFGRDVVIYAQALAITNLMSNLLKSAVRRPRPFTFLAPEDVPSDRREGLERAQSRHDADRSFPSGHASTSFAAATAGATMLTLDLLGRSRTAIALAWTLGGGAATTTAILRVAAGRHFPSDVVTGAVLGMGVGAAVPLAHWAPERRRSRSERAARRGTWSLTPYARADVGGLLFQGRFR